MLLAGKAAWAGTVFILLTTWVSGPPPTPLALGANPSKVMPAVRNRNDVRKMQQTLQGKGHYRGEVDGVFGLRTRASIRGFQKAENLPVTGQLDTQTAGKLGIRPEGREENDDETAKSKPSAGIKWAKGSGRTSKPTNWAVKVVQELLRHSTSRMTLDTYTQALGPDKRAALSKVVGMIRPKERVFSVYRDADGVSVCKALIRFGVPDGI